MHHRLGRFEAGTADLKNRAHVSGDIKGRTAHHDDRIDERPPELRAGTSRPYRRHSQSWQPIEVEGESGSRYARFR